LIKVKKKGRSTRFINPKPNIDSKENLMVISETATIGIKKMMLLLNM